MAVAAVAAVIDWTAVASRSRVLERCAKPAVLLALLLAAITAEPSHSGVHGWLVLALCCGLVGDIALSFAPADLAPANLAPADLAPADLAPIDLAPADLAPVDLAPGGPAREPVSPPQPVSAGGAHRALKPVNAISEQQAEQVPADQAAGKPTAGKRTADQAVGEPPSVLFVAGLASFLLGHLGYCVAMLRYGVDGLSVGFGLALVLLALYAFGPRVLAGVHVQGGDQLTIAVAVYIAALGSAVVLGVGSTSLWIAYGIVAFAFSDLVLATDRFVVRRSWAPLTVAITYHSAQLLLLLGLVR